jgi:hypothetical protein
MRCRRSRLGSLEVWRFTGYVDALGGTVKEQNGPA